MIATDATVVQELLAEAGAPARIEVLEERRDLLRFGGSRVTYQHHEEQASVRVLLVREGRSAWGSLGSLEPAAVATLRARLEAVIATLPPPAEPASIERSLEPTRPVRTFFASTAAASAADRAAAFRGLVEALPPETEIGGSVVHQVVRHSVASTDGVLRCEDRSRAMLQAVGRLEDRSSYARALDRDWSAVDQTGVVHAVAEGLEPLPTRSLETGRAYRAVLGPQAMATLVATLGQVAFGGRAVAANSSGPFAGRMGQRVLSPLVSLVDDGCDPNGLPSTFDCEGSPKQRVELVRGGVLRGAVQDLGSARQAGLLSTGHGVPPGWRFGAEPLPSHLLLESGDASTADLLAACEQGLFIQRLDYVRVVQGREALVTGSTRDATRWIGGGKIVASVPQFRFTARIIDLLGADRVVALGRRRERAETPFMESVAAPAAVLAAFPVDAISGSTG